MFKAFSELHQPTSVGAVCTVRMFVASFFNTCKNDSVGYVVYFFFFRVIVGQPQKAPRKKNLAKN